MARDGVSLGLETHGWELQSQHRPLPSMLKYTSRAQPMFQPKLCWVSPCPRREIRGRVAGLAWGARRVGGLKTKVPQVPRQGCHGGRELFRFVNNVVYPAWRSLRRTDSQSVNPFHRKWQLVKGALPQYLWR